VCGCVFHKSTDISKRNGANYVSVCVCVCVCVRVGVGVFFTNPQTSQNEFELLT